MARSCRSPRQQRHRRAWSTRWRLGLTEPEKPQAARPPHRPRRSRRRRAGPRWRRGRCRRGLALAQREDQADQSRAEGLPDEPRAGENAAGAAGAFARRARKDGAVVGGSGKSRTRRRKSPSTRLSATPPCALPGRPPAPVPGSIRPSRSRQECRPDSDGRRAIRRSARQSRPPPATVSSAARFRPPIGRAPPRGRTAAKRTSDSAR